MIHLQLHPPKWFYGLFLSIFAIASVAVTAEIRQPSLSPLAQRVEASLDGVVRISGTRIMTDEKGQPQEGTIFGTGFFVGENLIMTNNHVVGGGKEPTMRMRNSTKPYHIEIIAKDELSDVALVKIVDSELEAFNKVNKPIILKLESADDIVPGEIVYSVGHPWGFEWSVSQGIVSGVDRRFPEDNSPAYFLQTDAKIFSGNSGGPLIDENGKVVGMNTQIYINDGGSFGFAIPGELLKKIADDLQTKKEVVWPVLGVLLGVNAEGQVDVRALTPGKPAMGAGIKEGDIVLSMSSPINSSLKIKEPDDLLNMIAILNAKDVVTLEVMRKDVIKMISVVLDGKLSKEFL